MVGFGAFVILNMFQTLKITDRPKYNVITSPSVILLMVVARHLKFGNLRSNQGCLK